MEPKLNSATCTETCKKDLPGEIDVHFVRNGNCTKKATSDDSMYPMSKYRILKNLLVTCFGLLFVFTSYEALMNLQSTMNREDGLGTIALAVIYGFYNISSFVLPTFVIKKLGCKNTLILSATGFVPYIASNFYPTWETLIPSAVLCGISSGLLMSARSTYVSEISFEYATRTKVSGEVATSLFFGIACMFYQSSQIWGNVISYLVLRPKITLALDHTADTLASCGASFCDNKIISNFSNHNLDPPSDEKRFILTGIFSALSLLAAFVFWIFLDNLVEKKKIEAEEKRPLLHEENKENSFLAAFKQLKQRNQFLILPLTIQFGVSDGFFFSNFTKAYISCALGVHHVGFVMVSYGVCSCIISPFAGPAVSRFGRMPVLVSGAIVNLVIFAALLTWQLHPGQEMIFFIIACAWGYSDAIWWSQVLALYGTLFKNAQSAAFSNFYFWNSSGFLLAFAIEGYLCTYIKVYIIIGMLILGMAGYCAVEILNKNPESKDSKDRCKDMNNGAVLT